MGVALVIALLPVVGIIIAVVVAKSLSSYKKQGGEMVCGGCGYSVRGAANFTCPECGGDLRMVGIVGEETQRHMQSGRRGVIAIVALAGVLVAGVIGSAVAYRYASRQRAVAAQRTAVMMQTLAAVEAQYALQTSQPPVNTVDGDDPPPTQSATEASTPAPKRADNSGK